VTLFLKREASCGLPRVGPRELGAYPVVSTCSANLAGRLGFELKPSSRRLSRKAKSWTCF